MLVALAAFAWVVASGRSANARAGWGAVALMALVFVSPLCALSSALFSARVTHHVMLIAAVAPLLTLAFPLPRLAYPPLVPVVAAHAVIIWLWHAPGPYAWGLSSVPGYWLMQVTLLGSAWLMWRSIFSPSLPTGPALMALVATIGHMGLLGALIVFAPVPLYVAHFATTAAWGLTPLADQQLAGLLMWVLAMIPYLAAGLWLVWSSLRVREPAL
ncbi:cytochrome c oxidase assembly protein [Paraburkholderia sp. JPY169]|uniref:Cytochrome c oxidase assembly protein n=1 Tax=Paraburkholderia youngii TaxID=2782701 RepID=A0A7Y6JYP5_9BURK|nr:cytochrome c oxidase assembly protein [Paraburkholderia youngii]